MPISHSQRVCTTVQSIPCIEIVAYTIQQCECHVYIVHERCGLLVIPGGGCWNFITHVWLHGLYQVYDGIVLLFAEPQRKRQ